MSIQIVTSEDETEQNKTLRFVLLKSFEDCGSNEDCITNNSLEVSNRYGVSFIAFNGNLRVVESKNLLFNDSLPPVVRKDVSLVALSCDETLLAVAQGTQVLVFETKTFCLQPAGAQPKCTFVVSKSGKPTVQLAWNPSDVRLIAALAEDGTLIMIRVLDNWGIEAVSSSDPGFRCMSWSPKGKQLVVGGLSGIVQLKLDLKEAKRVAVPPDLDPVSIYWLSTLQFLIAFQPSTKDDIKIVLLTLSKTADPVYKDYGDIFLSDDFNNSRVIAKHIHQWKIHLLCSSTSSDVIAITHDPSQPTSNVVVQEIDDRYRPALPLEHYCRGAGVYLGYEQQLEINGNEVQGSPVLVLLSQKGLVRLFQMVNEGAESIHVATPEPVSVGISAVAPTPVTPAAPVSAPISVSTSVPAFGNLNLPTPEPGKLLFGGPPPGGSLFGAPATIGFATPPKPAASVAPISSAPATTAAFSFGSKSIFPSAVTAPTSTPAQPVSFGSLSFGQPKPAEIKPIEPKPEEKKTVSFAPPNQALTGAGDAASILPRAAGGAQINKEIHEIKTDIKKYDYRHLQEQIKQFEQRYQKFRKLHAEKLRDHSDAVRQYFAQLDAEIMKDLNRMTDFARDITETTKGQKEEVEVLFVVMQNLFSKMEYARIAAEKNMDSKYLRLLRAQPIDPQSLAKLTKVEKLFTYVKNQLKESRRHYYYKDQHVQPAASVEYIFKTLKHHDLIIKNLNRVAQDLRLQLAEQQMGRLSTLQKSNITFDDLTSGVSSLKLRPNKEDEKGIVPKRAVTYSKDKVENLKRWAGQTVITRVPITGAIDPYTPISQVRKIRLNPESHYEQATDSTVAKETKTEVLPSEALVVTQKPASSVSSSIFSLPSSVATAGSFGVPAAAKPSTVSSPAPATAKPPVTTVAAKPVVPAFSFAPTGTPATAASIFGFSAPENKSVSSIFSQPTTASSTPSFFGTPASTKAGLFGLAATTSTTTAPMFGATTKPAPSSVTTSMATSTTPFFGISSSSSLFGATPQSVSLTQVTPVSTSVVDLTKSATSAAKPAASSVPTSAPTAETKPAATVATTISTGLFGSATTQPLFGAASAVPLKFGTTPTSMFGSPKTSTAPIFGSTVTPGAPSLFGAVSSTASIFGTKPVAEATSAGVSGGEAKVTTNAPLLFGTAVTTKSTLSSFGEPTTVASSAPSVFGAPKTTATGGVFGTATVSSAAISFGTITTSASLFATPVTSSSLFGAPKTTATSPAIVFGAPPSETVTSSPSLFGAPTTGFAATTADPAKKTEAQATAASPTSPAATTKADSDATSVAAATTAGGLFGSIGAVLPKTEVTTESVATATTTAAPAATTTVSTPLFGAVSGTAAPSLFGSLSLSSTSSVPSVFGGTSAVTPAKPAASIFGGGVPGTPSSTPSIFGTPTVTAATTAASVFGIPATTTTASIFGTTSSSTTPSTSIFGAPATTAVSIFGSPSAAATTASAPSLFGTPAAAGSIFGSPASSTPSAGGGLFSAPSATTTGSIFGTPTTTSTASLFGAAESKPGFGSPSIFGGGAGAATAEAKPAFASPAAVATTSAGGFGSPAFGSPAFGSPPTTSSQGLFGSPSFGSSGGTVLKSPTGAFGASPSGSVFGGSAPAATTTSAFGASTSPSFGGGAVFGGSPAFGSALKPSAFGSTSIFGGGATSQANTFGGIATTSAPSQPAFGTATSTFATQQTAFGSQPAFGSTGSTFGSQPSGQSGAAGAFGSPAFGSTGAFGQQSSAFGGGAVFGGAPAFGSAVKPAAFGATSAAPTSSVFGGPAVASTASFGVLAQSQPVFGSQSQTFGAQQPQQQPQQQAAFGSFGSFGAQQQQAQPAFGGTGFGSFAPTGQAQQQAKPEFKGNSFSSWR